MPTRKMLNRPNRVKRLDDNASRVMRWLTHPGPRKQFTAFEMCVPVSTVMDLFRKQYIEPVKVMPYDTLHDKRWRLTSMGQKLANYLAKKEGQKGTLEAR